MIKMGMMEDQSADLFNLNIGGLDLGHYIRNNIGHAAPEDGIFILAIHQVHTGFIAPQKGYPIIYFSWLFNSHCFALYGNPTTRFK